MQILSWQGVKKALVVISAGASFLLTGCGGVNIHLSENYSSPLHEFTVEGKEYYDDKVLVIPIQGVISDSPSKGLFGSKPSMVQEVVSQLKKASRDDEIKAVILKINSPGGTVTASDVIYNEIVKFKKATSIPVVALMMDVGASGGYYVALPADHIITHPTTVTGSVGVVFVRPKFSDLMNKIGVGVEVSKSGRNKDMGSPFRESTGEEQELFHTLISSMADRFYSIVKKHRSITDKNFETVKTARVFFADEAQRLGLTDSVGYVDDAYQAAAREGAIEGSYKVVVYRRKRYANDNIYNTASAQGIEPKSALIDLGAFDSALSLDSGFYYVWSPAVQ